MEMCPDDKKRFPSHVIAIVVDNLNGAEANYESEEAKYKDVAKKTSFSKSMADVEKQDAANQFLEALDSFKSVYVCEYLHEVDPAAGPGDRLKCSKCEGLLIIAKDVATPLSELPWKAKSIKIAQDVIERNRKAHDEKTRVKVESGMTDNGGAKKGFIHIFYQKAIEGFDSADAELRHSLAQELAEKNAKIEFDGAVRTVPLLQVPEGIEPEAPNDVGNAELDGQKAYPEGENDFDISQFERLEPEVRKRAKELLSKLRSTLSL